MFLIIKFNKPNTKIELNMQPKKPIDSWEYQQKDLGWERLELSTSGSLNKLWDLRASQLRHHPFVNLS